MDDGGERGVAETALHASRGSEHAASGADRGSTRVLLVAGVCCALALASLAIPVGLSYDPWAWLTWGREITRGSLDTTIGPSWKPLPVMVTSLLPLTGGSAPTIWLVLTRAVGLLALVGAYRLSTRFAGRVAGSIAVALMLLTPDPAPNFVRLLLEGHTSVVTAALAVWAIESHLAGRHVVAFLLVVGLALDRPEAWPFLAMSAVLLWRNEPRTRWLAAVGCLTVPALWFGIDWWGSGSPWHGAEAAQVATHRGGRLGEAIRRAVVVVPLPMLLLAMFAVVRARRRRIDGVLVIAAGSVGWFAVVAGMGAVFGYAALPRFLVPGAALLCVLASIGAAWAWNALTARPYGAIAGVVLVVVGAPFVVHRAARIPAVLDEVTSRAELIDGLDTAIARAGGRDAIVACGRVAIEDYGIAKVALAWKLDLPIRAVRPARDGARGVTFASADPELYRKVTGDPPASVAGTVVAQSPEWAVVSVVPDAGRGRGCGW